jgi:hypothetical protein
MLIYRLMKLLQIAIAAALLAVAACHPGPVVNTGGKLPVGGTIAGIVRGTGNAPLEGRKVTAVNTESGAQFDATTGVNGGYTIKVPEGTYRIEVELRAGESVAKHPGPTRVNKSDLDPRRDFLISTK